MSKLGADEKVLSYGDVVLLRSDLWILRGPLFLNDRLISFFFSHLSSSLPNPNPDRLLLVPPSISFWIANSPDPASLAAAVDPLRLHERDLVLFPVNDNPDVTVAEGGSHWSLLVYDSAAGELIHHDSIAGANRRAAMTLAGAVKVFVGEVKFVEAPTPQQRNGCDCGLFAMAIARVVCDWYCKGGNREGERWFGDLQKAVDANKVGELRGELLRLILSMIGRK
ncbi:NEDD8-specific protease 1 [Typha angustifolia]|uniref:NEDD8-specific protease 1 n=1 Tax=Typha angustifolia TaxID=59011 RepID=UPI003C2B15E7